MCSSIKFAFRLPITPSRKARKEAALKILVESPGAEFAERDYDRFPYGWEAPIRTLSILLFTETVQPVGRSSDCRLQSFIELLQIFTIAPPVRPHLRE
jgi:hypothetical protein